MQFLVSTYVDEDKITLLMLCSLKVNKIQTNLHSLAQKCTIMIIGRCLCLFSLEIWLKLLVAEAFQKDHCCPSCKAQ